MRGSRGKRKKAVRATLATRFAGLVLGTVVALGLLGFPFSRPAFLRVKRELGNSSIVTARLASFAIPAKEHSELAGVSPKSFLYQGLNQKLWKIKRANPEILRIYTIVPHGGFGSYVLYAGEDPSAQYDMGGGSYIYPEMERALKGRATSGFEILRDQAGAAYVSGYAPIKSDEGEVVALLGVDLSAQAALQERTRIRSIATWTALIWLILVGVAGLLLTRRATRPLKHLVEVAEQIRRGDFSGRARVYSQDEVGFLASTLNLMLDRNENILSRLREKVDALSTLYGVRQALSSVFEVEKLLKLVAATVASLLKAESCSVMLLDKRSEELVVQAVQGPLDTRFLGDHLKLGEGIAGIAAQSRQPIAVNDAQSNPRFAARKRGDGEIQSLMSVPLTAGEKVLGVINVVNKLAPDGVTRLPFDEDDLRILVMLSGEIAVALGNAELYQGMQELNVSIVHALATAIDARDPYTSGHSKQITDFAVALANAVDLPEAQVQEIRYAGLLHDIGKIGIPEAVLQKPGALTEEELDIVRRHPLIGQKIIESLESLEGIAKIIYAHHENYDGTGYPIGLKGEAIPIGARILRVVDAVGAMSSDRPYRKAKSPEQIVEELKRNAGTQFDPMLVEAFLNIYDWEGKKEEVPVGVKQ